MNTPLRPRSRLSAFALRLTAELTACIVLWTSVPLPVLATTEESRTESIAFPENIASATNIGTQIRGRLYLPVGPPPYSAVVITSSSGGERPDREYFYAKELAHSGIAGLVVESFQSRGVDNSIHDQSLLLTWSVENDAIGALKWLVRDGRFRPDRIGITGVSKGGAVALNTALTVRRAWTRNEDLAFAAHAPISPPCNVVHRSLATTGKPIFFMLAEHDDQTRIAPCVNLAEALRRNGHPSVSLKVYEGAYHAWETLGAQPLFDPRAENYSECRGFIENDGSYAMASGERIPASMFLRYAARACMRLGTHCCGGTPAIKAEATRDLIEFFRRSGL